LETWTLKNPWVKSVTMGDLDYTSDDVLSMDVTLRYDWATLSIPKLDNQLDPSNNVGGDFDIEPGVDASSRLIPRDTASPVFKLPDGVISGE
jgi:hypothetical protein